MLSKHNLSDLGHCASQVVRGLDSVLHVSGRLCDFWQVAAFSGLNSFISRMGCLDHISNFLSFRQEPYLARNSGYKTGKGEAALGFQAVA